MSEVEHLFAEADASLQARYFEESLAKARSALSLAQKLKRPREVVRAARKVILATSHAGRREEALSFAEEQLLLARNAGAGGDEATLRLAILEAKLISGSGEDLAELLECADETCSACLREFGRSSSVTADALLAQANVLTIIGDMGLCNSDPRLMYEKATEVGKDALEIYQASSQTQGAAMAMHAIAAARINSGSFESGMRTAKEALRLWGVASCPREEVFEMQAMASWYMAAGRAAQGLPLAAEALQLARREQCEPTVEASAVYILCQLLSCCGQHARAVQVAQDARSRFQSTCDDRRCQGVVSKALALVHLSGGDVFEAIRRVNDAIAFFTDCGCPEENLPMLRMASCLNAKVNRPDEALEAAQKALQACDALPRSAVQHAERTQCMNVLIQTYLADKRTKDAVQVAEDARELCSGEEDARGEAVSLLALAKIHLEKKAFEDAAWAIEDAQALFEDIGDKRGQTMAAQLLATTHMSEARYIDAVQCMKQNIPLLHSVGDFQGEVGTLLMISHAIELQLAAENIELKGAEFKKAAFDAVTSAKDAVSLATRHGDRALLATGNSVLSRMYFMAEKDVEAVLAAKAASGAFRELGHRHGEALALLSAAIALAAGGQVQEAKDEAGKALLLFTKLRDNQGKTRSEKLLDDLEQLAAEDDDTASLATAFVKREKAITDAVQQPSQVTSVDADLITNKIRRTVEDVIGVLDIQDDTPLMMAGLTSQSAVMLRNSLTKEMGVSSLPVTLMFDAPSVSALADYFISLEN